MSRPANALDVFVNYTYHFELHASANWDELKKVKNSPPSRLTTTSTRPNGTLVINTTHDAHQVIDDVVFGYIGPSTNPEGNFVPNGEMTFKVLEPNGASFIEKIVNVMKNNKITDLQSLHWGLKVYFIGRYSSNNIRALPKNGIFIPLTFKNMTSNFNYRGAEYIMEFLSGASFATAQRGTQESVYSLAHCNKNLSVTASKVGEALSMLESKLNENYMSTYNDTASPGSRPLVYKINVDPEIAKEYLTLVGATSYKDKSPVNISFYTVNSITDWIFQVVRGSDSLNRKVAKSLSGLQAEGHPGVTIISVLPRVVMSSTAIEVNFDVTFYKGNDGTANSIRNDDVIEFDFMFSRAGANVDVLGFDLKLTSALAWFADQSVINTNAVTGQGNGNKTAPNAAKKDIGLVSSSDRIIDGRSYTKTGGVLIQNNAGVARKNNNITPLPVMSSTDETGYNKYPPEAVQGAKFMFSTLAETHGATATEFTFTIRGNLMILCKGILDPDVGALDPANLDVHPIGVKKPLWAKVNIRSQDGTPFFYTGRYNILSVENHFSGGIFKQLLHVTMMPGDVAKSNSSAAAEASSDANTPAVKQPHYKNFNNSTRLETIMAGIWGIPPAASIAEVSAGGAIIHNVFGANTTAALTGTSK